MSNEQITETLRSLATEHRMRGNHHYGKALRSQSSPKWVASMGAVEMMKTIESARAAL